MGTAEGRQPIGSAYLGEFGEACGPPLPFSVQMWLGTCSSNTDVSIGLETFLRNNPRHYSLQTEPDR